MTRLHNRIRKADYFSDGELLRWNRDKRATYSGLWAIAEDSGCLEDDTFDWKMSLWPSPLDGDITIDLLDRWRQEYIDAGKLIPYEAEGKRYLYLRTFHEHEHPRNPQPPVLPTPPWLRVDALEGTGKDGKRWARCTYIVLTDLVPDRPEGSTESVLAPYRQVSSPENTPRSAPLRSAPLRSVPTGQEHLSEENRSDVLSTRQNDPNRTDPDGPTRTDDPDGRPDPDDPGTDLVLLAVEPADPYPFDGFYLPYLKHEKRKACEAKWAKLPLEKRILATGISLVMADLWDKGLGPEQRQFVPGPLPFINGELWEDWRDGPPASWCAADGNGKCDRAQAEHDRFMQEFAAERGLEWEPAS